MSSIELVLVAVLLVLVAEVTYIITKLPKQSIGKKSGRPIFVDTSVLIDGRIIAVAKSGFIGDALVIPRSVIGELQFLADNADHEKRARARHGLDIVSELQQMKEVSVEILQDGSKAEEGVDERLLTLAKRHNGAVCTIDFNLNKVAAVEAIQVLNINELAQQLRMSYLPGETIRLELVQKGQDNHQGVGYLPDGTMVVVEQANKYVGTTVEIEFIRSLQTAAGKMMFARLKDSKQSKPVHANQRANGRKSSDEAAAQMNKKQQTTAATQQLPQKQVRQHAQPQKVSAQHRTNNRKQKRATSADRESALLDLVDKQ